MVALNSGDDPWSAWESEVPAAPSVPPAAAAPGIVSQVIVRVRTERDVDSLEVSVTGSEGLDIVGDPGLVLDTPQAAGSEHEIRISVIPRQTGRRIVNLFADTRSAGRALRRTYAVPVNAAADGDLEKNTDAVTEMPDGDRVISLPAQED